MRSSFICFWAVCLSCSNIRSQTGPEITSWIINHGETGYDNIPSNIQLVQYSSSDVYVSATCIPGYDIGPWSNNPNSASNQNFVYKITRNPVKNNNTLIQTPLGHIGVWSNGVSIYNPKDGMSYNNDGVWNRNALYYEGISFDECLGHPAQNGEYHHHVNPKCLYDDTDSMNHSPIIGFAFDGFPIYGAYAFTNTDGTGAIKRMQSSYVLNTSTTRTNGPAVDSTYPAGCFVEDYTFIANSGDLDEYNGRFSITPDYPNGIYAYFVTINDTLYPDYPFVVGPKYYGTVQSGNTGQASGHNTISESVTTYDPYSSVEYISDNFPFLLYPNPAKLESNLFIFPSASNNFSLKITDLHGKVMTNQRMLQSAAAWIIDLSAYESGNYLVYLETEGKQSVQHLLVMD